MAYVISTKKGAAEGVRDAIEDQLAKTEKVLASEEDVHETVKEIRKRYRKIRAAARLARGGLGDDYHVFNVLFRDESRALSLIRDAQAQVETLDSIVRKFDHLADEKAITVLRADLEARRDRMTVSLEIQSIVDGAQQTIDQAREMMDGWEWSKTKFKHLKPGLKKSYKRSRKHMKKAYQKDDSYHFHEWRKYSKYHRYHLHLLRKTLPELVIPRIKMVSDVTELIGDDHDLEIFVEMVKKSELEIDPDTWETLQRLFAERSKELREEAKPLGKLLFNEPPKIMYKRLKSYWQYAQS